MSINEIAERDLAMTFDQAEGVMGGHRARPDSGLRRTGTEAGYVHIPATASSPSTYISVAALEADPNRPSVDPNAAES
jgi:hypothetical protein